MAYIGGSGALILETQSSTGSWNNGLSQITDPNLGTAIGLQDDLIPTSDAAYDIGTKLKRIRTIHTTKLNDDSAGETLEIGNYTADTGVTGVYGQLQGKGGSWKLSTTGGNGVLGGAGLTIGPDSGITYVNGGLSATGYIAQAGIYNVRQAGAKGDGTTDDTVAIQAAIDYCRTNNLTLWFPCGRYKVTSALNWTQWKGFHVKGGDPGAGSITATAGITAIVSSGVTGVVNDFSGSSYGKIEGLSFYSSSGTPKCHILLARVDGVTNGYGSDITLRDVNIQKGTVASIVCHSAEVITFDNCKIQFGSAPGILITNRAESAPFSITSPAGLTLTTLDRGCTVYRINGGEITGDNSSAIQLDWNGANGGADFSMIGCYIGISGSNTYAMTIGGSWYTLVAKNTRVEATSLGSNYGAYKMAASAVTSTAAAVSHAELDADLNAGTFISGTGNFQGCRFITGNAITFTGNFTACEFLSVNPLDLTVTGSLLTCKATVPSVTTLSVSGTKEISVVNTDYHSTVKVIAGDTGLAVQNTALNKNLVLDPTTGGITGNSVPVIIASGGNGVTIRPASGQTTTIGDTATASTWICPGSGASTTTTNIGSNNGSSTNTINIGLNAANDKTTILGTLSHTSEFISLYLSANATLSAGTNVTNSWPSMTTYTSTNLRYLSWNDTSRAFVNSHPTLPMTVMIHVGVEWGTSTGGRAAWVNWGATPARSAIRWWAAGDATYSGGACVVSIPANGGTAAPVLFANSGSEVVNGNNTGANTSRTTLEAAIIC